MAGVVLRGDAIRPWFHRSWILRRDPNFAVKAAVSVGSVREDLRGEGQADDEFVICPNRTSIQPHCRCRPTLPPEKVRRMRVEHEYDGARALACLAAYEVQRAKVMGRCKPTTGIAPFGRLVEQVVSAQPYASAARVFWIVDNRSSHRGKAALSRRVWSRPAGP